MAKINEDTEVSVPLKNLIGIVVFTAISVWAYFEAIERINFLEHDTKLMRQIVIDNKKWINDFKPPPEVQDTIKRVRDLELKVKELEIKGTQK
jgi:signal recognition particle receptor subunit beta